MQASDVKLGLLLTVRVETFLLAGERRKRENVRASPDCAYASVCPLAALLTLPMKGGFLVFNFSI
jgi:hypothetical protein